MVNIGNAKDPDFYNKAYAEYERFKGFRSEVIEAGLSVENALTYTLDAFFTGASAERSELLRSLVLDAEFCTFFQKRRLLKQILDRYEVALRLDPEEMKTLRRDLHDAIALRNRFAHGSLFVDAADFSVSIEYFEGTRKVERLEEAELVTKKEIFHRTCLRLLTIRQALQDVGYKLPAADA
jgi:hypothetical protein